MFLRKQQTELASPHPVEFLPARYSISVRLVVLLPSLDLLLTQLNSTQLVQRACKFQATCKKKIQVIVPLLFCKTE